MNKKLQVFVSSTYTDLIEERQSAVQAILDAGHIPAGMELFKAGKSQMKTICKWIDESDVYMLILGGRYGSIEETSGLSYTELEYQYAISKNMPVFAIVLDDSFLFTKAASQGKNAVFEKDNVNKYDVFKFNVTSNIVKFVSNIDQISSVIHSQLNFFLNDSDYNLIGWSKNILTPFNQLKNNPINTTEVKMVTFLNMSPILPLIKDSIEQTCNSLHFRKHIRLKHIEEMSYTDIQEVFSASDIIIFDVSDMEEGDIFLLGYLVALKKNVILICKCGCQRNCLHIKHYHPAFSEIIFYNDHPHLEFFFMLKNCLDKYFY